MSKYFFLLLFWPVLNVLLLSMSFLNLMLAMHRGDAGGTDGDCAGDDTYFLCSYLDQRVNWC